MASATNASPSRSSRKPSPSGASGQGAPGASGSAPPGARRRRSGESRRRCRLRQAAGIDEGPGEVVVAPPDSSTALRKMRLVSDLGEMKSVERVELQDVLVRRRDALTVVAVEQRLGRLAAQHQRAASSRGCRRPACRRSRRARRRARPGARCRRRRSPGRGGSGSSGGTGRCRSTSRRSRTPRPAPSIASMRARTLSLLQLLLAVDVPADLEVDAPDAVGLLVQQRGVARCGRAGRTRTSARSGSPPSSAHRRSGSCPGRRAPRSRGPASCGWASRRRRRRAASRPRPRRARRGSSTSSVT